MKRVKKAYVTLFLLAIALYGAGQSPVISSFSPLNGPAGTSITISGLNFSAVAGNNIVYIGGIRASVTASTTTSITAVVPAGLTSAPISVTTNNLIAYSRLFFVVTFPVVSTNFSDLSFGTPVNLCSSSTSNRGGFFGDLNDDGKLDMLSSHEYGNVAVTKNTSGGGNISFDPNLLVPISNGSYGTSMADYDGDGKLDIAMAKASISSADFLYGQLSVIRNNTNSSSTITFDTRLDLYAYEGEKSWYWITSADIDNDGKIDIILTNNSGGGQIAIFRNTSTQGTISFALPIKYTTPGSPREATTGDVDGDGKRDIIIATQSGVITVFRNMSTPGSFSLAPRQDFTTPYGGFEPLSTDPGSSEVVVFADVDNDGKPDILVSHNNYKGSWSVFRNTSNIGSISLATRIDFTTGPFCYGIATGDLNGDGKLDIAACTREYRAGFSSFLYVFNNQSTPGNISFVNQVTNTGYNYSSEVLIADLNNDSKPELILKMQGNGNYVYFKNNIPDPVLPLQLLDFTGYNHPNSNELNWQTTGEANTSAFTIEHSFTGINFLPIGSQQAAGFSSSRKDYAFIHPNPGPGESFYRLKMIDRDSAFTYSKIIKLTNQYAVKIALSPNPVRDLLNIQYNIGANSSVRVIDAIGQVVKYLSLAPVNMTTVATINIGALPTGLYTITINIGNNQVFSKKIIKE